MRSFILSCWLVALSPSAMASVESKLTEIASIEGITEYELDNGLRVLLFPDASSPTITVNITYLVGSRHEGYGETGMAHLLEHLVFKGTPTHPDIPKELTERGARANGGTSYDRTNYYETFPSSEENLEWAISLEADRMINSFISAEDLESEMTVVRNEMESGENSPLRILRERVQSASYLWHNYGQSIIGARSDVENVPIERLQQFYKKYYQPDNAVLVIAGKFDEERAKEFIIAEFGTIPAPIRSGSNVIYPTYTEDPPQDGERTVTLRRKGETQFVMASYHVPAGSHEEFPAIDIMNHALSAPPSGRLHRSLVETGLAANVAASAPQLREAGLSLIFAEVRNDRELDMVWDVMQKTIYDVARGRAPITEEEVERAKAYHLNSIELMFNDSRSTALQLSWWVAMGDWRLLFLYRDGLEKVTKDDVNRVASNYLKPQNSTVGFFIPTEQPDRATIPRAPNIADLVEGYKGREVVAAGESFDPTPDNIEERIVRVTLRNGFKLAMLPKKTRGANTNISLRLRFGNERDLAEKASVGELVGGMLMRGTKRLSRQELTDEFTRLKVIGGLNGNVSSAAGSMLTTRANLPAVLRLASEVLKEPRFDKEQFDELKEQVVASLEGQKSDPGALASNSLERHLSPYPNGHPAYAPTIEEAIAMTREVELEELGRFHRKFFGASNGHMAIIGDFDPDETLTLIEELFGDWDSKSSFQQIERKYFDVAKKKITIDTPDKANAYFLAGSNIPMRDDHEDFPSLLLGNFMLGGGFLSSRLAERIRQEDGLSYSVGSQFSADPIYTYAQFGGYAIYAPENADLLEDAFLEEIQRVLEKGFSESEVEEAKKGFMEYQKNLLSNDRTLAGYLSNRLFLERDMFWTKALLKKLDQLEPDDIREAMARHITLDSLSIVIAGDFEKE